MGGVNKDTERGPQTQTYGFRSEAGKFGWRGMWVDGDPSGIPDDRFRILKNARLQSGMVVPRPGQRALNTTPIHSASAKIISINDFQMATPYHLFQTGGGCPWVGSGSGRSVGSFFIDQSPALQSYTSNQSATSSALAVFDGSLWIAYDNVLRKFNQVTPDWGTSAITMAGAALDIPILTIPSPTTSIAAMETFDGKLFMACLAGAGTGSVVCYDGVTRSTDLGTLTGVAGFAKYRELLVLGFSSGTSFKTRPIGIPGTTWTSVAVTTPVSETAAFGSKHPAASFKDILYWATGTEKIAKWTGTGTATNILIATSGIPAGAVTVGCTVFNNCLYVLYNYGSQVWLAMFDGVNWSGTHKQLTLVSPAFTRGGAIGVYDGNLIVGGTAGILQKSPGTTTTGTWVTLLNGETARLSYVDEMVIY
jgi:hypothetical protein